MQVGFGGVDYELVMVDRELLHPDGRPCNGLTWPDRGRIEIDGRLPFRVRLKTVWHEIGHAFKCELDIHDAEQLDEEAFCNLVALALCTLSPEIYLRIRVWASTGRTCLQVAFLPGMAEPVPIWRLSDEPPEVQRSD